MREDSGSRARPTGGKLGRRRALQLGAAALVLGGAAVAVVRTRGYPAPPRTLASLSAWQYAVVAQAARRITAPDRPADPSIPSSDDLDVVGFVDAWMARMPPKVTRDLGRFLGYLEHLAPVACGMTTRFTRLGPEDQDRTLAALEASSVDLLRAGFEGLKSLVFMGYYRDPATWRILGYDGPLVGRPKDGW